MSDIPLPALGPARFDDTTRDKLRLVAKYQRWVLVALLASTFVVFLFFAQLFELFAIPADLA